MEIRYDYQFRDWELLRRAMTHRSFVREYKLPYTECNERLEFLGDSLLNFLTTEHLHSRFPDREEGALTKLRAMVVCEEALYIVAGNLGIAGALRLGKNEESNGGRRRASILADAVEAYIAAVYLDGGMEFVRPLVLSFIPELVDRAESGALIHTDHKSALQEYVQQTPGNTLEYKTLQETGPAHDRTFTVGIFINGELCAEGTGHSKKEAQQAAAGVALAKLNTNSKF